MLYNRLLNCCVDKNPVFSSYLNVTTDTNRIHPSNQRTNQQLYPLFLRITIALNHCTILLQQQQTYAEMETLISLIIVKNVHIYSLYVQFPVAKNSTIKINHLNIKNRFTKCLKVDNCCSNEKIFSA